MNYSEGDNQPLVSIITLNYNRAEVTAAFLESSKSLLYPHYEILVCDMASSVNPTAIFDVKAYTNTKLLLSDKNLGFAGGNNWGIRHAKGDFIFIVNNDTELTPEIIQLLLLPFFQNPAIGAVCPKIKYFNDKRIIQYAGFRPMNPYTGRTSAIGDHEPDNGQYNISGITHGAHGCAMMVKKEVIEKTGMFPEKFFLYYEEWDWSARIQKAGYKIWYQSEATIYHKESMTVGKENPLKVYYHTRNRILYMRRNSNPFQLFVFSFFFTFISMPKAIIIYLESRQMHQLRLFMKGVFYNFTHNSKSEI
ncbi:MAG TPA: glycosyltransferase family 2 protein [Puia sp.]|jgi:GT2 family glycosyltransferase|nr:glycosyltransferase family 2 protein [Puia sp.]